VGSCSRGDLVDDARISVLDHGFTVADGVFETMKATPAGAFAVTRHLRRLGDSASILGLPRPDEDAVRRAVDVVVRDWTAGGGEFGRVRVTYTAGTAPLGSDRGEAEPTLVVAAASSPRWAPTTSVVTVPWTRNERSAVAGAKTTSYAENVVALRAAHEQGASEAVLANTRGELCEGTGSNVFVVVGGRVLTPPVDSGCLAGITRELALEWFDAVEEVLPLSILQEADEVFLTSSTRDVHPVVRADARHWPSAGPVASRLQEAFRDQATRTIDP
jgi:branched-chain amino acid aminotransferase